MKIGFHTFGAALFLVVSLGEQQARAQTEADLPTTAIYMDLTRSLLVSVAGKLPLVGFDFERQVGNSGWAFLGGIRGGYVAGSGDDTKGGALGLGFRKYLYQIQDGSFLQFRSDVGIGKNQSGTSSNRTSTTERFSITGLEYGYKWQTPSFLFSAHAGPAFYAYSDSKTTFLIGGVDVGFPISARSFHLP